MHSDINALNPAATPLFIPSDGQVEPMAQFGMDLLDHFASSVDVSVYKPMESYMSSHNGTQPTGGQFARYLAGLRYAEAIAMLKERMNAKAKLLGVNLMTAEQCEEAINLMSAMIFNHAPRNKIENEIHARIKALIQEVAPRPLLNPPSETNEQSH